MEDLLDFGTDPLFMARSGDPHTSHAAAASVNATKLEQIVYDAIKTTWASGAISDDVLTALSPRREGSVTPRYACLARKGLIYYVGDTRPGKSGCQQRVMRVTESFNIEDFL